MDRPWMTALEMQFSSMRACAMWLNPRTRPRIPSNFENLLTDRGSLVPLFKAAETYAWSKESVAATWQASKTIPRDTVLDRNQLPSRAGWWWFEGGLDNEEFVAALWGPTDDGLLAVCCFVQIGNNPPDQGFSFTWQFGTSIGTLLNDATNSEHYQDEYLGCLEDCSRFFVAACAWLQQKVVISSSGHIERHRRKQLAREYAVFPPSDVRVIQLRRAEASSETSRDAAIETEWSCRWIVGGHWRNQYHPSSGKHELKYILPYVKGPSDKPLKVPTHTVYAVTR